MAGSGLTLAASEDGQVARGQHLIEVLVFGQLDLQVLEHLAGERPVHRRGEVGQEHRDLPADGPQRHEEIVTGQVNFACAEGTRQILWVFALLTSRNNPAFQVGSVFLKVGSFFASVQVRTLASSVRARSVSLGITEPSSGVVPRCGLSKHRITS
jgi:hypothetical protein